MFTYHFISSLMNISSSLFSNPLYLLIGWFGLGLCVRKNHSICTAQAVLKENLSFETDYTSVETLKDIIKRLLRVESFFDLSYIYLYARICIRYVYDVMCTG